MLDNAKSDSRLDWTKQEVYRVVLPLLEEMWADEQATMSLDLSHLEGDEFDHQMQQNLDLLTARTDARQDAMNAIMEKADDDGHFGGRLVEAFCDFLIADRDEKIAALDAED